MLTKDEVMRYGEKNTCKHWNLSHYARSLSPSIGIKQHPVAWLIFSVQTQGAQNGCLKLRSNRTFKKRELWHLRWRLAVYISALETQLLVPSQAANDHENQIHQRDLVPPRPEPHWAAERDLQSQQLLVIILFQSFRAGQQLEAEGWMRVHSLGPSI